MITKEKLGYNLRVMREKLEAERGEKIKPPSISDYIARTIESGSTSYFVKNLISYCNDLNIAFVVQDKATLEACVIEDITQLHKFLVMMMERYNVGEKYIYRKEGVNYTKPKNGKGPLSITTMLAVCKVLHIKVMFHLK